MNFIGFLHFVQLGGGVFLGIAMAKSYRHKIQSVCTIPDIASLFIGRAFRLPPRSLDGRAQVSFVT
jgi:hypothetical protein